MCSAVRTGLRIAHRKRPRLGSWNSWHAITVKYGDEVVGMGRVIGDGGCHFQIVDVCVLPDHQGKGLAKQIMAGLISELEDRAPKGAFVSLIADGDAQFLYESLGLS